MQISVTGDSKCRLKTKTATIELDGQLKINDLVLDGPGEYEKAGVFAEVTPDLAHLHIETLVIAVAGQKKRQVTETELARLEDVDLLFVHADNESADELQTIAKLIGEIEPRIVILVGVQKGETFARIGGQTPETVENIKMTKSDLPEGERKIYLLKHT